MGGWSSGGDEFFYVRFITQRPIVGIAESFNFGFVCSGRTKVW